MVANQQTIAMKTRLAAFAAADATSRGHRHQEVRVVIAEEVTVG